MRTPHTFQIGSTTYTTREYCNARGITDNARILKIQWRINTYIRNHTIQQTIEELDRLTLHPTHPQLSRTTHPASIDGIRPWQGTKKEREIAQQQKEAREAATRKMITQQHNGETATKAIDQRELLKQSEWMEHNEKWLNEAGIVRTPASRETLESMLGAEDPRLQKFGKTETTYDTDNPIENAIHQLAQALRNATRLTKELKENQKHIEHWKEITANLLNQETLSDRTKRYNRPEKVWSDT